jgi:hypothetical protein
MKSSNPKRLDILIPNDLKHYEVTQPYKTPGIELTYMTVSKEPQRFSTSVKRQQPLAKPKRERQVMKRFISESYDQYQNRYSNSPYNQVEFNQPNVMQNIVNNNIYLQNLFVQSGKNNRTPKIK